MTQENRTSQVFEKKWLEHYMYREIHEIFFVSFPSKLYEWIANLADSQGRCRLDKPIVWTLELVRRLEASEDKIVRVVDNCLDQIIRGLLLIFR